MVVFISLLIFTSGGALLELRLSLCRWSSRCFAPGAPQDGLHQPFLGSTSMGGTGTSGALPTVPRACGDFRGASSSLDGLRESSLGGVST
jgi:hypothetical protein